jgi:hypothetical protein
MHMFNCARVVLGHVRAIVCVILDEELRGASALGLCRGVAPLQQRSRRAYNTRRQAEAHVDLVARVAEVRVDLASADARIGSWLGFFNWLHGWLPFFMGTVRLGEALLK